MLPSEEQLTDGDAHAHAVLRACADALGGEVHDGVEIAVAAQRDGRHILQAQTDGVAQLQSDGNTQFAVVSAGVLDRRGFHSRQHAIDELHFHLHISVHTKAGARAETHAGKERRRAHPEGLGKGGLGGQRRANAAVHGQQMLGRVVLALKGDKGVHIRAEAAQHGGLRGDVDIAIRAGLGQQLVRRAPLLEFLLRAFYILRVFTFPAGVLARETGSPGKHRPARGQNHQLLRLARNADGQTFASDEGNSCRNVKAKSAVAAE